MSVSRSEVMLKPLYGSFVWSAELFHVFATRGSGYIFSPKYLHVDGLVIFSEHHGVTG